MKETEVDGHVLRSAREVPGWGAALVLAVCGDLGFAPGAVYFAELVARDDLFPDAPSSSARRQRVERLLQSPVEVDGALVVTIESDARVMYQKTKRVVVRAGVLDAAASAAPPTIPILKPSAPAAPPANRQAAAPPAPPAHAKLQSVGATIDAARLREVIAEEVQYRWVVDGPPPATYEAHLNALVDTVEEITRRVSRLQVNTQRLFKVAHGSVDPNDHEYDPPEEIPPFGDHSYWHRTREKRIRRECERAAARGEPYDEPPHEEGEEP